MSSSGPRFATPLPRTPTSRIFPTRPPSFSDRSPAVGTSRPGYTCRNRDRACVVHVTADTKEDVFQRKFDTAYTRTCTGVHVCVRTCVYVLRGTPPTPTHRHRVNLLLPSGRTNTPTTVGSSGLLGVDQTRTRVSVPTSTSPRTPRFRTGGRGRVSGGVTPRPLVGTPHGRNRLVLPVPDPLVCRHRVRVAPQLRLWARTRRTSRPTRGTHPRHTL